MPLARTALPTSASLKYAAAVSMWRQPHESAKATAFSVSYRIRFFDGFAVIVPDRGDPSDFFGFGTTIAGIYAKIPAVG